MTSRAAKQKSLRAAFSLSSSNNFRCSPRMSGQLRPMTRICITRCIWRFGLARFTSSSHAARYFRWWACKKAVSEKKDELGHKTTPSCWRYRVLLVSNKQWVKMRTSNDSIAKVLADCVSWLVYNSTHNTLASANILMLIHYVSKNGHQLNFCDYSACCKPIFKIFGNVAAKEICNRTHISNCYIDVWYLIVTRAENTPSAATIGINITQRNPTLKLVTTEFEMNAKHNKRRSDQVFKKSSTSFHTNSSVNYKVHSGCWGTT